MHKIFSETESLKQDITASLKRFELEKKTFFADVRVELVESKSAGALNGNLKGAEEDLDATIGVRVFVQQNGIISCGYAGTAMDLSTEKISPKILKLLGFGFKSAHASMEKKTILVKKNSFFSKMFSKTGIAETTQVQKKFIVSFKKSHLEMPLENVMAFVEKNSKQLFDLHGIAANEIGLIIGEKKKIFASSDGSLIEQVFPLTESFVYVAAKGKNIENYYSWLGNFKGLEVLEGQNEFNMTFEEFCSFIANGTIKLSNAPALKPSVKPVTVITDPWFNALLSHEIMGHPSEADRALKKEGAWAGRAWWFNDFKKNKFGQQIANEQLNVFSDPSLKGYGHYLFDDEGTKAQKVFHIKNGKLNEFLNSRETAFILDKKPNGGMRAMNAAFNPLVRMNNTVIGSGKWKKNELFEDTKNGYYVVGQKTPSIGETRQNFKITCWKIYKIKNGQIGTLFRQGGISSDSHVFLNSIDAIANDFKLFNIPNCGKGTPMQTMRVANGGPHLRAKAKVTSSHESN